MTTTDPDGGLPRLFAEDVAKLDELIIAFGRQEADFMQLLHQRPYRRNCRGKEYRKLRDLWVKQHAAARKSASAPVRRESHSGVKVQA